jgi:hypothetical protein
LYSPFLARDFTEADIHPDSGSNLSTTVAIIDLTMARRFIAHGSHFNSESAYAQPYRDHYRRNMVK